MCLLSLAHMMRGAQTSQRARQTVIFDSNLQEKYGNYHNLILRVYHSHIPHLSWVLVYNPDHSNRSVFLLNKLQTGSLGVRSVTQAILPVEVPRADATVAEDRHSSAFKHWNLQKHANAEPVIIHPCFYSISIPKPTSAFRQL